jgi:hypothetical protein
MAKKWRGLGCSFSDLRRRDPIWFLEGRPFRLLLIYVQKRPLCLKRGAVAFFILPFVVTSCSAVKWLPILGHGIGFSNETHDNVPIGAGSEVSRMSKSTRKVYDPKFKMRVALEVLRGEKTLSEVASENGVAPDLCQYFGHKNLRFYAAIAIAFSIGFVRSKNASIASAGIL